MTLGESFETAVLTLVLGLVCIGLIVSMTHAFIDRYTRKLRREIDELRSNREAYDKETLQRLHGGEPTGQTSIQAPENKGGSGKEAGPS